ncbi:MAG: hypothetical protein II849_02215 [Bacteroidales bacterium]|nr:hypothetical protein [Bacteroidales bacterium]
MKKVFAILTVALMSLNVCNAQQSWFEGEASYSTNIAMAGMSQTTSSSHTEYYKNGNVMSDGNMEKTVYRADIRTERSREAGEKRVSEIRLSDMAPVKAIIDRTTVTVDGHKCILVTYTLTKDDPEMGSAEVTTTDWVDISYAIPYLYGRVNEVPQGLVVQSEATIKANGMNLTTKTKLNNIKQKAVKDSKFEL